MNAKLPLALFAAYVVAAPAGNQREIRSANSAWSRYSKAKASIRASESATIARSRRRFSWNRLVTGR